MGSFYRKQLEDWLKTIEVKAENVIDIGGGANMVLSRLKAADVKEYQILDNYAERDCHKTFEPPYYPCDIQDTGKLKAIATIKYDVAFCLEVFEYIFDPLTALKNINWLLKYGGLAYISFPSIYPVHEPKELDSLRYTKQGIIKLMTAAGFSSWEITPRVATDGRVDLFSFYQSEHMRPVKGDEVIYDIGYLVKGVK